MHEGRLTERQHWDEVWRHEGAPQGGVEPYRPRFLRDYGEHVLWDVIYPTRIPRGARAVEIGVAPGDFLMRLARTFDLDPYGIEYSEVGAARTREVFAASGYDPAHVLEGDFFSDELLEPHRGTFGLVLSRGFIEHFEDVEGVIARHVALLAPGGRLMVAIPRMRGIYKAWMQLVDPVDLARHNQEIMEIDRFAALFEGQGLRAVSVGTYGALAFKRFIPETGSAWIQKLARAAVRATLPLNPVLRAVVRPPGISHPFVAPYLLYVGDRVD